MSEKASARFLWPGFLFFTAFAAASLSASSQHVSPRIASIEIRGNQARSANEIMGLLNTRPGTSIDSALLREDLERVHTDYLEGGYLFARAHAANEAGDGDPVRLVISIDEGFPAVIDSVVIRGLSVLSEGQFAEALSLHRGQPFAEAAVEDAIRSALKFCEQRGYPTARISLGDITMSSRDEQHHVRLSLLVNEGVRAEIEEIRIEGNKTTEDGVILREIALGDDRLFTDERAVSVRRSLERLQLFSSVSPPEFFLTEENKGAMLIRVREGDPNRFDGMIGYSPAASGNAGFITGLADVQFRNLFGTGRKFSARWIRESQATQEFALRFLEPWVGSLPVNAEIGFYQRKQDSTYVRRTFDASIVLNLADNLTGGLTGSQTEIVPSERPDVPVAQSSQWSLGGTVRYDTRDHSTTPTEGLLYATTYEVGRKSFSGGLSDATNKLTFDLEVFASLSRQQVFAVSFHGRNVSSSLIEAGDLFRVGGAASLRGYRENQFQGSRIAWSSVEYRFLTGGRSFVYGFVDGGYIRVPERAEAGLVESEFTRIGYGVGVRLDTGIGLMTVGLALGEGDTFRTAKLHFRLTNEF